MTDNAFQELQVKMVNSSNQIKMSHMQIETLKQQNHHAKLVYEELNGVTEDTKMYQSIGRMFLLQPKDVIKTTLDKKVKTNDEKITNLQSNREYLEKSITESQNNLREMVQSRQLSK